MKLGLYNMVAMPPKEVDGELVSPGLGKEYTREIAIVPASSPSLRCNSEGVITDAIFALSEPVVIDELLAAEGVDIMTNDDMVMNTIFPNTYLRIENGNEEGHENRWRLRFTNEPIPEPPAPPPEPAYEDLLFEAKEMKRSEIMINRDNSVQNGIWVETAFGLEHFSLNEKDQILLLGISSMVMQGVKAYPYHSVSAAATGTNICTIYSDEDIGKIAMQTFAHVTYHESYANMLMQWLNREEDLETVRTAIFYGAVLPEDLMSYLAMILSSSGIDPMLIPGYVPPVLPWEPGVFTVAPQAAAHVTYASEGHCEILVHGINVLPCILRPEDFGDVAIEDPECIELRVDVPVQPGDSYIIEEMNPLLGRYFADHPSVSQLETGEWVRTEDYVFAEDSEEPIITYPLLVGGKMLPEDEPFPEIHINIYRPGDEPGERFQIMTYTISSTVEFGDGTDIPDPDMPVFPAPPPEESELPAGGEEETMPSEGETTEEGETAPPAEEPETPAEELPEVPTEEPVEASEEEENAGDSENSDEEEE